MSDVRVRGTTIEVSASQVVENHSRKYGEEIIRSKFPSAIDGLTLVHRRILWAIRNDYSKELKSATIVANTMDYHPHGDMSIYNTMVRMSRPYEFCPVLIESLGDNGNYSGDRGAHLRYTKNKMSEFAYDIFFRGIDQNALYKTLMEDMSGTEPLNFVPSIPTALLYGTKAIGFGFGSHTNPLNLSSLCDLVIAFVNHMKQYPERPFDYSKHVDKFIPDFPVRNVITNYSELINQYKQGNFNAKIMMDGTAELSKNMIRIFTLPYGMSFDGTEALIQQKMDKRSKTYDQWYDRSIINTRDAGEDKDSGHIVIIFKNNVNIFEAWDNIRKLLSFSGSATPRPNYSDNGFMVTYNPLAILRLWYDQRFNILVSSKKHRLTTLTQDIRIVEAYLVVVKHTDDVIAIVRGNTLKDGIDLLMAKYDLTLFQAEHLCKVPLSILASTSADEQNAKHADLTKKIADLRHSFTIIPDEIAAEVQLIKRKYVTPRITEIPNYIGYVKVGGGCIQFTHTDEVTRILELFPKVETEIHMYDGPHLYKVLEGGKLDTKYIPKYTTGDIYGLRSNNVVTVNIVDGAACCVKGFIPGLRAEGYYYTTTNSKIIRRNGSIESVDITKEISLRKTICRGANTDICYVYPCVPKEHYVLALNTETPNVLTIQRVTDTKNKIIVSPVGEVSFVHSFVDKDIFINTPERFLNRNSTRVIHILDVVSLLGDKNYITIDINASKWKNNKHIKFV